MESFCFLFMFHALEATTAPGADRASKHQPTAAIVIAP
jgi:hypothetical protein